MALVEGDGTVNSRERRVARKMWFVDKRDELERSCSIQFCLKGTLRFTQSSRT